MLHASASFNLPATLPALAPRRCRSEAITCLEGNPGPVADAWSAGVMLYALLFSRHPFERPEDAGTTFAKRVQTTVRRILEVTTL